MTERKTQPPQAKGLPTPTPDTQLVARIVERGVLCSYPRNAVIQTEGEPGDTLRLVLSGRLKVFVGDRPGQEVRLATLGPGDFLGLAMLDGGQRGASVRTLTSVRLCILTRPDVDKLIARDRAFTGYLLLRMTRQLRALTSAVRSLGLQNVHGRVRSLLLELARDEGGSRVVRPRLSQREIADRVGASPGMISRVIKQLVSGGYITVHSTGILVHKAPAQPS